MAQYIQTPFDHQDFDGVIQVSQISYHDVRMIEILYEVHTHRVVIQNNGQYFYLTSPDIQHITINQVLIALGYENDQAVVTWADQDNVHAVLNEPVATAPLNQITVYPPGVNIPENHYEGPLPMIEGEVVINDQEFGVSQQADYTESVDDPSDDDSSADDDDSSDDSSDDDPSNDDNYSIHTPSLPEYKDGFD